MFTRFNRSNKKIITFFICFINFFSKEEFHFFSFSIHMSPSGVTVTLAIFSIVVSSPDTLRYAFGLLGWTIGTLTKHLFSERNKKTHVTYMCM